jgi:hypothetical protein
MEEYKLSLTDFQLTILLDTVKGLVDNRKLIHVPVTGGGVAGLPLTQEALEWMLGTFVAAGLKNAAAYTIRFEEAEPGPAPVTIDCPEASKSYDYTVNLADFDEQ